MENSTENKKEVIEIKILDFELFADALKYTARNYDSAKITIKEDGMFIYSKRELTYRSELKTNCVSAASPVEICIENLMKFNKIIDTIKSVHDGDFSDLRMSFDGAFIKFKSRKGVKMNYNTQHPDDVKSFVGEIIDVDSLLSRGEIRSSVGVTTSSTLIKMINNHSFIFSDTDSARIYLSPDTEMENNVLYATIRNSQNELDNSITLKFGLMNFGVFDGKEICLDFNRLNVINTIPSENINVDLMEQRFFLCRSEKNGKNGTFLKLNLIISYRKDV